jgi:hypothetical protein
LVAVVGVVALGAMGCGYARNLRDDFLDCGTLAVGVVPPVVPTEEGTRAVGFLPPCIGIYAQFTDLLHLGALAKGTGDLEWDRRGLAVTVDKRCKFGVGPFHWVWIEQEPVVANAYKTPDNEMDGWRDHMRSLRDPVMDAPAKVMIFRPEQTVIPGLKTSPWLYRGWQDWEFLQLEVGIPEPFILHSGIYVRGGLDPSQVFDLVLGIFTVDLYDDAAYELNGDLKY